MNTQAYSTGDRKMRTKGVCWATCTLTDIIVEDLFGQISHVFVSRKKDTFFSWLSFSHAFVFDEADLRSAWIWWKLMSDHLFLFCSRSATGNGHSSKSKRRQNEATGVRLVCCLFFIALEMNDSRNCRAAEKRINNLYQFASVDRRKRSSESSWLFFFKCQNKLRCWIIWRFFSCDRRRRLRYYKMPL